MPATLVCPICGGELPNQDLRLHRNIIFCNSGAVALGPVEMTFVKALLRSPGGLTSFQLAEISETSLHHMGGRISMLDRKLNDIGSGVRNIGCRRGPGAALYVIRREER